MKVSYKWLEQYFEKGFIKKNLLCKGLPAPKKLAELFNNHAFEVEGIEKISLKDGYTDTVLDIKVLPDRAHYALSHRGIAREASMLSGREMIKDPVSDLAVDESIITPKISIQNNSLCTRYMMRKIANVSVTESPAWLRQMLESVGSRSINNIVDATNCVMLDIGQPLHAFDADKVSGSVSIRNARADEKIVILDGREMELKENDLVIADDNGPIAIAGVKGGKRAEVTTDTKNILLESANFNPTTVRKTSTRLNLRNDSSKRFENEITPALAEEAMARVSALINMLAGSVMSGPVIKFGKITDIYPSPVKNWHIQTSAEFISSVVGKKMSVEAIKSILEKETFEVSISSGDNFTVTPPIDRLDIKIPEDIADEIARIIGYENITPVDLPKTEKIQSDKVFFLGEKIKDVLLAGGFSELQTYALVPKGHFEISYPLASDKSALRESLLPKVSESMAMNARNADLLGLEAIKVFEIGSVFPKTGENVSLVIGALQIKKKKGVNPDSIIKEAVIEIESVIGTKIDESVSKNSPGFIEINLTALADKAKAFEFKDIDFKPLPGDKKYQPFSIYPFIVRDVALFVPNGTTESDVCSAIKSALDKKILVKGPDIFDKFEKDGKLSLAFRMIFQSFERTLSDEEVNTLMEKAHSAIKSKGWQVR